MKSKNIFLGKLSVRDSAALIDRRILTSILQVKPINLTDLQDNEKLELTSQYRYFLRSLTYPIQIVLRTSNRDSEKFLYRKRMADVEETIKKIYKNNFKEVLVESDAFKNWLKLFLETNIRPIILCYIVIPVIANIDVTKNQIAYIEALQLLNQRTSDCISRLSLIKAAKKTNNNAKRSEWEEHEYQNIQEKKAMIALKMFKRNKNYYSLNNFSSVNNGQKRISDYAKANFYDELIAEQEISLDIKRLNDNEILNLFDSYCKDYILLIAGKNNEHLSIKELFTLMNKPAEMEAIS